MTKTYKLSQQFWGNVIDPMNREESNKIINQTGLFERMRMADSSRVPLSSVAWMQTNQNVCI